jgi:hypothetical protein
MDVLWNFTYAHTKEVALKITPMSFFDLTRDPFHQAADRASGFLFLRGDFPTAKHTISVAVTEKELASAAPRNPALIPNWNKLALVSKVGTSIVDQAGPLPYDIVFPIDWTGEADNKKFSGTLAVLTGDPYDSDAGEKILSALKKADPAMQNNRTNMDANVYESDNGAFYSDPSTGIGIVKTERTAGAFALDKAAVDAGALRFTLRGSHASVWANALDDQPLAKSKRVLLTHLTDLQNIGVTFAERAHRTLISWGTKRLSDPGPHHLMKIGEADIALQLENAENAKVYGLAMTGERLSEMPTRAIGGWLHFTADTRGTDGGRMYYEIVTD